MTDPLLARVRALAEREIECSQCEGKKWVDGSLDRSHVYPIDCPTCGGSGRQREFPSLWVECPKWFRWIQCPGSGQTVESESVRILCPVCTYYVRISSKAHKLHSHKYHAPRHGPDCDCAGTGQVVAATDLLKRLLDACDKSGERIALVNDGKGHWGLYGSLGIVWHVTPEEAIVAALESATQRRGANEGSRNSPGHHHSEDAP